MSKYINAADVFNEMRKHRFEARDITIGEFVDEMPSADVVEVVRCKDCKHYLSVYCFLNDKFGVIVNENEFCSRGERKETE